MSKKPKSYFLNAFGTILLAAFVFWGLKNILPARLFPENNGTSANGVIDSLALEAIAENGDEIKSKIPTDSVVQRSPVIIKSSAHTSGYSNLISFYEKLYNLENAKQGKIRIAYFSDSMTDGDFIVQDIRNFFQKAYGGEGVGFVGITSQSAASRYSVAHQYSKNWKTQSFLNAKNPKRPFGIDGQVCFTSDSAQNWVRYRANDLPCLASLNNPTLFYGSSVNNNASISVSFDKDSVKREKLNTSNILNTISFDNIAKNMRIDFHRASGIPIYGVNFDDGKGVHVDNFSIRGNSGLPLVSFNKDLMRAFDEVLHYDLIILHYGTNVLNYGSSDYSWYERKMSAVVEHLKDCFPNAAILIVSSADKSTKIDMDMRTDKAVEPLVNIQKSYANNTNSGFINLYSLMGGNGSMSQWVKESLGNKDYTHFSAKGSKRIGDLIYKELNNGYLEYKRIKK